MKKLTLKQLKTIFIILLAVFLIASVITCSWLYLQAGKKSESAIQLNMAVSEVSSIAETLKASGGSLTKTAKRLCGTESYTISDNTLTLYYDDEMQYSSEYSSSCTAFVTKEKNDSYFLIDIKISTNPGKSKIYELEFKIPRERR